jgi:hypothetical protein
MVELLHLNPGAVAIAPALIGAGMAGISNRDVVDSGTTPDTTPGPHDQGHPLKSSEAATALIGHLALLTGMITADSRGNGVLGLSADRCRTA